MSGSQADNWGRSSSVGPRVSFPFFFAHPSLHDKIPLGMGAGHRQGDRAGEGEHRVGCPEGRKKSIAKEQKALLPPGPSEERGPKDGEDPGLCLRFNLSIF